MLIYIYIKNILLKNVFTDIIIFVCYRSNSTKSNTADLNNTANAND